MSVDKIELIKADLGVGKKVLVVCNTVLRAQAIYSSLKDAPSFKGEAVLLHSAFNSEDRAKKESKLKVEKHEDLPPLLVGTQAIEVSLDIDYDVIYTELAPLDALLQRFGRVNRAGKKNPCPCYVFAERNEKDKFIYSDEVCERTLQSMQKLASANNGVVDEAGLQEQIDFVYPDFDEKSKREFEKVRDALRSSLQQLVPFHEDSLREDDFYKQFDGVKVIPAELWPLYKERIGSFKFMEAEFLKVGIRKCEVSRWMRDEILTKEAYPLPIKNKAGEQKIENCLIVHLKYDPDFGLMKNERLPASTAFIDEQLN